MSKPLRRARKPHSRRASASQGSANTPGPDEPASREAIKAAEQVALAAFSSGLRLAAAFGSVAAKTTSMALASLATGADKFSELVKKEALSSSKSTKMPRAGPGTKARKGRMKRS